MEKSKVAFLRLLASPSVGVRDVDVKINYERHLILGAPATHYDFSSGYDDLARQHFVRTGFGSVGNPVILVTSRKIKYNEDSPNGIALELFNAIVVATGRGAAEDPGVGLYRNENIIAHELGHLAGYRGNAADPKHSTTEGHVMHHAVQPGLIVGDPEYAQRIRAYVGDLLFNTPV